MAPSIPRRSRKRRTAHRTSTAQDERGAGRGRPTRSADSLEQSIAKEKIVMDSDAPYLPQEIITNILQRLPVKSLIRFQCVCKRWKNLFKTLPFIAEHLRHSTQQNPCLLFKSRGDKCNPGHLCLINRDMQVLEYQIPPSSVRSCCIVGCSSGLLCLVSESFILWNPATREVLQVPKVPNLHHTGICFVGFGFSPIVNDYKIVRISLSSLDDDRVYLVQVFSLSTRSWKEVEVGKLKGIMPFVLTCGFTFDGAIFWFGFGFKSDEEEQEDCLISFDIATESFTLIPIPRSVHVSDFSRLTTYENKLAMLSNSRVEYKSWTESTKSFSTEIWVMENCIETSGERWIWTKIYTINPYPYRACFLSLLTIWRNELFAEAKGAADTDEKKLVLCNLHTNKFKTLAIGKYPIGTQIWNYAESLVSVGNIHIEASSS